MDCSPRNFPGKNTEEGCHFLLQGIFLTQGSNLGLFCNQVEKRPIKVLKLQLLPSAAKDKLQANFCAISGEEAPDLRQEGGLAETSWSR